jgi:hypothetical protein
MEAQETPCRTNRPSQWTSFVAAEEASWLVGPIGSVGRLHSCWTAPESNRTSLVSVAPGRIPERPEYTTRP